MTSYFISHEFIFKISGKDAARYLNARLSNNIKILTSGQTCNAAALLATGGTEAALSIFKIDDLNFLLFAQNYTQEPAENIIKTIEKFKVADNFTSTFLELTCFHFTHISDQELSLLQTKFSDKIKFTISNRNLLGKNGKDLLIENSEVNSFANELELLNIKALPANKLIALRIQNNMPFFGLDYLKDEIYSEAQLWQNISDTKGCYVGQEVIERARSIGKLPFQLVRIEAALDFSNTTETKNLEMALLNSENNIVGQIRSFYIDENNKLLAFARIKTKEIMNNLFLNFSKDDYNQKIPVRIL